MGSHLRSFVDLPRAAEALLRLALLAALIYAGYVVLRPDAPTNASARTRSIQRVTVPAAAPPAAVQPEPEALASLPPPASKNARAAEPDASMPAVRLLNPDEIRELQAWLKVLGFEPGPIDGTAGTLTVAAVRQYQTARHREETGSLDRPLLQQIRQEVGQSGR